MCQQLSKRNIGFERSANKIVWLSDFAAATQLAEKFNHLDWPGVLMRQVTMVNPLMADIAKAGFGGYWLGIDQAEFASDILFKSRTDLQRILKDITTAAITGFGA